MLDLDTFSLRQLITYRDAVPHTDTLESVSEHMRKSEHKFVAILKGEIVLGVCSTEQITQTLSARFGFAIYGKRPISEFLMKSPCIIEEGSSLKILLSDVFTREDDHFYEDVVLVDKEMKLVGLIPVKVLVRLQNTLLEEQLKKSTLQQHKLALKNQEYEKVANELELSNAELVEARNTAEQATRLKSEFLANMSHEIRTPMNGVVGMLSLLSETRLDKDQLSLVNTAESSADALLRIINDILDISKIEAGKLSIVEEGFNPNDILDSCIMLFQERARKKHLQLVHIGSRLPDNLLGDAIRIRQILANLISNALKFTNEGSVTIETEILEKDAKNLHLCIRINDTGIGLTTNQQARLFQPFVQADGSTSRKFGGTGLGLSISRKLAHLMGGEIECKSVRKVGSTFSLTLPLKRCESLKVMPENEESFETNCERSSGYEAVDDSKQLHILVVEDNLVNQEVARRFLRRLECQSDFALNGQEAIEMVKSKTYDMIFMDCQMPVMDGYEATRRIRQGDAGEDKRSIFISAMTANAMAGDQKKCFDVGMDSYVAKPIRKADLIQVLGDSEKHRQLNKKPSRPKRISIPA
jgi:signal transduction histidine kinase/ActR/RegA family two-component response regulator